MSPSKRKTWNSAQKYIKTGASKQEIQCASAVIGNNVMQTKGKGLPPSEATGHLGRNRAQILA